MKAMKARQTVLVVICFIIAEFSSMGLAAESKELKVTLRLPEKITLGLTSIIPIYIETIAEDGKPVSGENLNIAADFGTFLLPGNVKSHESIYVQLVEGKGAAILSMGDRLEYFYPVNVIVRKGPYGQHQDLAIGTVDIRYPAPPDIPKESIYRAKANGVERPIFTAIILDQKGEPIPGLDVRIVSIGLESPESFSVTSDSDGCVIARLAARRKPGTEFFQIMAGEHVSQQMQVIYTETDSPLVSLQDIIADEKTKLSFDSRSATATVKGGGINLKVQSGESIAWLDGNPVPMGGAAVLRNGILYIPEEFAVKVSKR